MATGEEEPDWKLRMRLAALGETLIAGAWIGLMLTPDTALDVPTTVENGRIVAAYVPVSEPMIVASMLLILIFAGIGIYAAMYSDDVTLDRDWSDDVEDQLDEDIDQV